MARQRFKHVLDAAAGSLTVGLLNAIKHTDGGAWRISPARSCAGSARCSRNTASAASNCARRFRKNPTPRSKRSSAGCGTISAASPSSSPISTSSASRVSAGRRRTSSPIPGIEGALRLDHQERQGDDRLCRASGQLGAARRRRQADRRAIRRAVPAAEYRRRQRRHYQAARAADGPIDPDRARCAGASSAACCKSGIHVGMLADQHYSKGVEVTFFGRPCLANPLIAMLARQTELPDPRHACRTQARRQ